MLLPRQISPKQIPCYPFTATLLAFAGSLILAGCSQSDQISRYQVPKEESLLTENQVEREQTESASQPARMLVAIIPQESKVWFFKFVGSPAEVNKWEQAYSKFVDTIRFENAEPVWQLPENWQELPAASAFRYKTITLPGKSAGKPLEIAVSNLGSDSGADPEFLLPNLNRWRGQLSLPAVTMAELDDHIEKSEANGISRIMIDLTGNQSSTRRPPFASGKGVN